MNPGTEREPRGRSLADRGTTMVSRHGRALAEVVVVSGLGILATAGFQIAATRGLGPESFGLLASFLAFINIAAIGSAALRNSVAVTVAEAIDEASASRGRRFDSSTVEAVVLGTACTIGLVAMAPTLATSLQSDVLAPIVAAATIMPYFVFARALGLLQGQRNARAVVWWSTGAQLAQLGFALVALALGYGAVGILIIYAATIIVAALGSTVQTRRLKPVSANRAFSATSSVVLLLTICFAWLTNIDVILVRSGVPEVSAGAYAAAAVLVKTTLILPATLSLYLLPRFVTSRHDSALSKRGVNLAVAVTFAGGLAIFAVLAAAGSLIVPALFGEGYGEAIAFLPWMAFSWIPWAVAQAVLVRVTALASRGALVVLAGAAACQWLGAKAVLPHLEAMIAINGAIGLVAFASLYAIHMGAARVPQSRSAGR